jgi:hypothetical protein
MSIPSFERSKGFNQRRLGVDIDNAVADGFNKARKAI